MRKTIGILAHVDAGKTTFSESILYHTKAIRKKGRVDHKDSFLDSNVIEKERGITIFSEQAIFDINNSRYYLIDTPGHMDFSPEMERAIKVLDYAIILLSAVEGIQGNTKTVYNLLQKNNVPVFFFINKDDREGSDYCNVIEDLKANLNKNIYYLDYDLSNGLKEELIEFICEYDDSLMEKYLEGNYHEDLWINTLVNLIKHRKVFIASKGSALLDTEVSTFINNLDKLTKTSYDNSAKFSGKIYKITHDDSKQGISNNKMVFIKILSGKLKVKDELEKNSLKEKVNELYLCNGNKLISVKEAEAGDICVIKGLNNYKIGDYLGKDELSSNYNLIPTLMSKVIINEHDNIKEILKVFKILEEEKPELSVIWNEKLKEIHIHIMGKVELEVLKETLKNRFNLDVSFGKCSIVYKETIKNSVYGYGHFEPLRHYAEVVLKIEQAERNSEIKFESICPVENLNVGEQNLIKTHIFEKPHKGILMGADLTDIKITLINGKNHIKHTSGGDFREATLRALRQGLEQAENILLEPYYKFEISAPINCMGKILTDIERFYGTFNEPIILDENVKITGEGPVETFMDYPVELAAITKGQGSIMMINNGYKPCHNEQEILKNQNYDKNADIEYTSSSIFCSKGQGYIVPWNEVKDKMHCLK